MRGQWGAHGLLADCAHARDVRGGVTGVERFRVPAAGGPVGVGEVAEAVHRLCHVVHGEHRRQVVLVRDAQPRLSLDIAVLLHRARVRSGDPRVPRDARTGSRRSTHVTACTARTRVWRGRTRVRQNCANWSQTCSSCVASSACMRVRDDHCELLRKCMPQRWSVCMLPCQRIVS